MNFIVFVKKFYLNLKLIILAITGLKPYFVKNLKRKTNLTLFRGYPRIFRNLKVNIFLLYIITIIS